jgi:hypothetical protein
LVVPAHLGRVAEGYVVDVDEDFVFALTVPDLAAGVARVHQDRADGALRPCDAAAVPVATGVVRGRGRDAIAGQVLGDGVETVSSQELGEDPLHHRCGWLVDRQRVQPLAVSGLGRVRMRPGVDQ